MVIYQEPEPRGLYLTEKRGEGIRPTVYVVAQKRPRVHQSRAPNQIERAVQGLSIALKAALLLARTCKTDDVQLEERENGDELHAPEPLSWRALEGGVVRLRSGGTTR